MISLMINWPNLTDYYALKFCMKNRSSPPPPPIGWTSLRLPSGGYIADASSCRTWRYCDFTLRHTDVFNPAQRCLPHPSFSHHFHYRQLGMILCQPAAAAHYRSVQTELHKNLGSNSTWLDSTRLDTFDVSSPCILAVSS